MIILLPSLLPKYRRKDCAGYKTKALPENKAFVWTDAEKLYSILINLVKMQLSIPKKDIELGYTVHTKAEQPTIEFYVTDTGSGITRGIK